MPARDLIHIGDIARPHGIKGEVCVDFHAESPFLLDRVGRLLVGPDRARARDHGVASWRLHKGRVLLFLEGVRDRDQAETLRGLGLFVRRDQLPLPEPDDIYLFELEGCAVLLPDGTEIGVVDGFMEAGGQEVWSIRAPDGSEILFPVHQEFVVRAEPDLRRIVIDPPPGLLDIYLPPDRDAIGTHDP